ncbi:MarR family EPS-associated transcriptional regulator [Massilia sp. TSP1-1-2]|uniref:MarR family EPS-associated transcriptional regulator n=1 Tax=Massilia sp. TSP1-1-2 TaxID=2804649 RepID=UPI003CEC1001
MHEPNQPLKSRQSKLQEDTYYQVMHILRDSPDLTQRELAERLGVSVSGLNYCLKALINKGWVKMQNFSYSKNKFGYVYILTAKGIAEKAALTGDFLKRKLEEYDALKAEIETLKAELSAERATQARSPCSGGAVPPERPAAAAPAAPQRPYPFTSSN